MWISTIYNNPQCCVTNNGYHSEFFQITRGIRQGCTISALLFILVVEVMAINMHKNNNIKGIQIHQNTIKISQLTDDTTVIVQDIKSVEAVLGFCQLSVNIQGFILISLKQRQLAWEKCAQQRQTTWTALEQSLFQMPRHLVSHRHCENDR